MALERARYVTGTLYNDPFTYGRWTIDQTLGAADGTPLIPGDGIVGFAGGEVAQFPHGAPPFFHSLCLQGLVSSCRFGIVLGSHSTGTQVGVGRAGLLSVGRHSHGLLGRRARQRHPSHEGRAPLVFGVPPSRMIYRGRFWQLFSEACILTTMSKCDRGGGRFQDSVCLCDSQQLTLGHRK
ncbi:uncharacterized protein BP01DRAFT_395649 [Aspergillus saccharolyticus JOP 1030-1]|uniref:Uncharacterized protein n=1 Tax=Aspergillus saccharolyticus JOP 1030-1 TaxID=1450539 RepID=A0A318ZZA8_9EURO|nr:hypothetical protein BP01DRAFT_395649 [Aspergillus saccharolyticus JOP 1030-1]PYH40692.1 hypothetical protein BP01DRAFT_395649 [Aspergillus saccharolyticus JOP 1030-1]